MLLQCVSEAVLRHIPKMSRNALGHEHVLISEDLGRGESAVIIQVPNDDQEDGYFST